MMYTNQVVHSPFKCTVELYEFIERELNPKKFAVILHDKDISETGKDAMPHFQAMMCFENARSLRRVAKILGEEEQALEKWDGKTNNGFSYLIHATSNAKSKFQYNPRDVQANFDFCELIDTITKAIDTTSSLRKSAKINLLLDLLYTEELTKKEVEEKLSGSELAKAERKIDIVYAKLLKKKAELWREEMIKKNEPVTVVWIYGETETGKSTLAKLFASRYAEATKSSYFMSGSSRDIFQEYEGSHVIVLDELRAKYIPYSDLLRLLNPYGADENLMAPSRFTDKAIACNVWVITSPYNPYQFYKGYTLSESFDSFEQLLRRITVTIKMTKDFIEEMFFDDESRDFLEIPFKTKFNPYSFKNREKKDSTNDAMVLFERISKG